VKSRTVKLTGQVGPPGHFAGPKGVARAQEGKRRPPWSGIGDTVERKGGIILPLWGRAWLDIHRLKAQSRRKTTVGQWLLENGYNVVRRERGSKNHRVGFWRRNAREKKLSVCKNPSEGKFRHVGSKGSQSGLKSTGRGGGGGGRLWKKRLYETIAYEFRQEVGS